MARENPALKAIKYVVDNSSHVSIDYDRLKELCRKYAAEEMTMPKRDSPVFPEYADDTTIDFILLGNSINFAFTDFKTGQKYEVVYKGDTYTGAYGMWASLKRALDGGKPILDGDYLSKMTLEEAEDLFRGGTPIPMLEERVKIFNEVGDVLNSKYQSRFHNLVKASNGRLFDDGNGLVERLVTDFPSFRDSNEYKGKTVVFNKRAQLAAMLLHAKFLGLGKVLFPQDDVDFLTPISDYEFPKIQNKQGVLIYDKELERKIEEGILIPAGSEEEVELRANAVWVQKLILDYVNASGPDRKNALHIDYKFWSELKNYRNFRHHLTVTTAY